MTKYAGRSLTVALDGGSTFPQLREFGAFGSSRNLIDATAYGDDWEDFVTGLQAGDEIPFTIAYDPADTSHADLVDIYENTDGRTILNIVHTDSGFECDVHCIINALRREAPVDGLFALMGTAKIVNPGVIVAS